MIEAVGHNHLGSFFRAVEYMLSKDGIFVMQAITMPDARWGSIPPCTLFKKKCSSLL